MKSLNLDQIDYKHADLAKSLEHFGFKILDYKKAFIQALLRDQVSVIRDSKDIKGKVKIKINMKEGTIDHGINSKGNNQKSKGDISSFIKGLQKLELTTIQEQIKDFLSENFSYTNMKTKIDFKSDKFIILVEAHSQTLLCYQMCKHRDECLLFAYKESILNYVFSLRKLSKEKSKLKEEQSRLLNIRVQNNNSEINALAKKQKEELELFTKGFRDNEEEMKKEISLKIIAIDTKFRLSN